MSTQSSSTLLPITAILLSHDLQPRIAQTLQSIHWAKEIIILDQNSGNSFTAPSPEQHFVVLTSETPITDFSQTRQALMQQASEEWVFFVDSDEIVSGFDTTDLARLLQEASQRGTTAYSVNRSDIFLGKKLSYGEAGNQRCVRIMRKDSTEWRGSVHETPIISGKCEPTAIQIDHYAHTSISEFVTTVSEYAHIAARTRTIPPLRNYLELALFPLGKLFFGLIMQGGILDG